MQIITRAGPFQITQELANGLKAKYPHVDLEREMSLAYLWTYKRKAARPTNPVRFIENWVKKIQPAKPAIRLVKQMTESELLAAGRNQGISPRPGEEWAAFARRLK